MCIRITIAKTMTDGGDIMELTRECMIAMDDLMQVCLNKASNSESDGGEEQQFDEMAEEDEEHY